ncbi:syntaxin-6 [Diabrotica virgifera virgifera]|uniref:Syntaxin-6 n=1 Tax=Diabrotica virgifera virgifera TaxID=50390 RepID=A0A6P7GXD0_DIAVI|nr:syntaxin-6 [Diabrotica virgifera virgifera]
MTLEDPFFVVKDEVFKALNKTRGLFLRWSELQEDGICCTKDEVEWTNTELKNSLRSIEWDLEDLEDTIDIVEKNPSKFKIDNKELTTRKHFIDSTKNEVKYMKESINMSRSRSKDRSARQPLLESSPVRIASARVTTKYSKLENDFDSPQRQFLNDTLSQQQYLTRQQDEHLEAISDSLGSLKTVSRHIGIELDEQAGMLDELGTDLENTDSKLDSTIQKVAKVLRLSNDGRQWTVIIILVVILVIVILLFFIL